MERVQREPTIGGYTKVQIEHELFDSGAWGSLWVGEYESGGNLAEKWRLEAMQSVDQLIQLLEPDLSVDRWPEFVAFVRTSRRDQEGFDLDSFRSDIAADQASPSNVLNGLVQADFDIECEPEDGDGWVEMGIKLPGRPEFLLTARGYYWMERFYQDKGGNVVDVSNMSDIDISAAEELGDLDYDKNEIYFKITFAAASSAHATR